MATIRKRLGKFQVQVRRGDTFISKTFINKSDALKWSREQEVKIEQGTFTAKKESITLSSLLERWEKEVLINLKSFPVERYKVALVSKQLGHLHLDNITSSLLASYRDKRLTTASNQTTKHELGLVRRAMKKGIEWGYIDTVPFVASPTLKGQARTRRLTNKEIELLLSTADDYLKHIIIFLIETAMRRGELAKMKIKDIDQDTGLIVLRDTKNGLDRIVPLSKKGLTSVKYLIKESKTDNLINYNKEWLTGTFIKHCKNIGIVNFRLHDLRHEGVSSLFEKGLNMMEVSSISGHKDLSMLRRYTHINPLTLIDKL